MRQLWADRAARKIKEAYESGELTKSEYFEAMRKLDEEEQEYGSESHNEYFN